MSDTNRRKELAVLGGLLVMALVLRIWLMDQRWISPDEGAH